MIWGKAEKDSFRNNLKSMFSEAEKDTLYFHEIEKLDYEAQEILADVFLSSLATRAPKGERRFNGLVICSTSSILENRVVTRRKIGLGHHTFSAQTQLKLDAMKK